MRKKGKEKGKGSSEALPSQIVPVHRTVVPSVMVTELPATGYVVFEMVMTELTSRLVALVVTGRY